MAWACAKVVRTAAMLAGLLAVAACATSRPPAGPRDAAVAGPDGTRIIPVPFAEAATANAGSLQTLAWTPFGRAETGWEIYLPLMAVELDAPPVPQGVDFARALARWQRRHGLASDGVFAPETFARVKQEVQMRRPFLQQRAKGGPCPDPPDESTLAWTTPAESWGARPNQALPGALAAWRRMRAAAVRDRALESPASMQVFSAYRSPAHDAARCAAEGNCDNIRRATCSAHRTGAALDLVLDGVKPVDSTADADRLRLSRSSTYRWLLANAAKFGFVNYPFEPWHWEWTGP